MATLSVLLLVAYAGFATIGRNGMWSWGEYRGLKSERTVELVALEAERSRLAHHVALLDPENSDPDLIEEMIRRDLGFVRADEVIVMLQ